MQKPSHDPDIADEAPSASDLTGYDELHLVIYLRLLDAEDNGADWTEVARFVVVVLEVGLGGGRHRVELDCEAATPRRAGSEKISQTCEFNDVRGR